MPICTMPSGLKFEFREMKVSDEDAIAEAEASGNPREKDNTQERAVSIARAEGSSASDIADMEDRLRLYRQGRPYREKR